MPAQGGAKGASVPAEKSPLATRSPPVGRGERRRRLRHDRDEDEDDFVELADRAGVRPPHEMKFDPLGADPLRGDIDAGLEAVPGRRTPVVRHPPPDLVVVREDVVDPPGTAEELPSRRSNSAMTAASCFYLFGSSSSRSANFDGGEGGVMTPVCRRAVSTRHC